MDIVGKLPVVPVSVYSDYTCPWCYVGLQRLERAKRHAADKVTLDVVWKPFEIHPDVPAEGLPFLGLSYPPDRLSAMLDYLQRIAPEEGLDFTKRLQIARLANTHRALLVSAYTQAEEPEAFDRLHRKLFHAYFTEGKDIGDAGVLREIAMAARLDIGRMELALAAGDYESEIEKTTAEARRRGITGTPTFTFGNHQPPVPGAQPTEVLLQAIQQTLGY